jgi:hypothetical protein
MNQCMRQFLATSPIRLTSREFLRGNAPPKKGAGKDAAAQQAKKKGDNKGWCSYCMGP